VVNFHELYSSYAADVYRFAFWLAGDSAEAEDITSETFIRAWVHHDTIRTETLKAYLLTIARNLYLEDQRNKPQQISLEDIYPDPGLSPEHTVESQSDLQAVKECLHTLPEIDRTAFILRVQHELSYAEIARSLNISLSAAKVKVHRVRKRLIMNRISREEVRT
jgi:RNA polymerase sigma factor (sigma-70 family)